MKIIILILLITVQTGFAQNLEWRLISTSPGSFGFNRLDDLFFINSNTGWVIDREGSFPAYLDKCFKTVNGGYSWTSVTIDTNILLRSIGFADSLVGWIGALPSSGGNERIYKTTDGGLSWTPCLYQTGSNTLGVCGISVINKNIVYATGIYSGPAKYLKTTNGGDTWSIYSFPSNQITYLIDCSFFNADSGFVTGGVGANLSQSKTVVYFTSDGGNTWVNKFISAGINQWGWKIDFPTRQTGYIAVESYAPPPRNFLKTTDGGNTWFEKHFTDSSINQQGIGFINENTGWIGGHYSANKGYQTTDGGDTWTYLGYFNNINRIRVINDTLAYASGDRVYKYTRDVTINITNLSNEIPEYNLFQNYPNPFNPITQIKYSLKEKSFVNLTVFDITGKTIAVLINKELEAGIHSAIFNSEALNLSSGIYFYRIKANSEIDEFIQVNRMVLLK